MSRLCTSFLVVLLVVVAVFGAPKTFDENVATLQKVDVDSLLTSARFVRNYIDCVTDKKPCTPEGEALKESWKEGLDKGCEKCDEQTQKKIKKIVKYLYIEKPEWYREVCDTLDKDKKYTTKYQSYISGILRDCSI